MVCTKVERFIVCVYVHILYVHTYVSRLVRFSKCSLKKSADFNHLKSNPYSSISDRFVPPYFKMRAGLWLCLSQVCRIHVAMFLCECVRVVNVTWGREWVCTIYKCTLGVKCVLLWYSCVSSRPSNKTYALCHSMSTALVVGSTWPVCYIICIYD